MSLECTKEIFVPEKPTALDGYKIREKDLQLLAGIHLQALTTDNKVAAECMISPENINAVLEEDILTYEGSINSYIRNKGLGLAIWELAEYKLIERESCIKRHIEDASIDNWTTRHLPEVLEYLRLKGISIQCLMEGISTNGKNNWLFLLKSSHLNTINPSVEYSKYGNIF